MHIKSSLEVLSGNQFQGDMALCVNDCYIHSWQHLTGCEPEVARLELTMYLVSNNSSRTADVFL